MIAESQDGGFDRSQQSAMLISNIRNKGKSPHGFIYNLWCILQWVQGSEFRQGFFGVAWVADDEFRMDKQRFLEPSQMAMNTLNFKLRAGGFKQSRRRDVNDTYWKCTHFCASATEEEIKELDARCLVSLDETKGAGMALYFPMLDRVRIFMSVDNSVNETLLLKRNAIGAWNQMLERDGVWAVARSTFIERAAEKFCQMTTAEDPYTFKLWVTANKLDVKKTAMEMISYVVPAAIAPNGIITIEYFCIFYARFGPSNSVLEKLHQLLQCSVKNCNWFSPTGFAEGPMVGSYSETFANCFTIKLSNRVNYHVYNNPLNDVGDDFLFDEGPRQSGRFRSWGSVLSQLNR